MDLLMAVCNELFLKSVQLYLFWQNEFNSVHLICLKWVYWLDKVLVSAADAETSAATPWERV